MHDTAPAPTRRSTTRSMGAGAGTASRSRTKSAVSATSPLATTRVRPRAMAASASLPAVTASDARYVRVPGRPQPRLGLVELASQLGVVAADGQGPAHDGNRDQVGGEISVGGQQRQSVRIVLARYGRVPGPAEQHLLLRLDEGPLLLNDEYLVESLRKLPDALGLEGPRHRNAVERDAEPVHCLLVEAEEPQGFLHVEVGLARCDQPQLGRGSAHCGAVQSIGANVGLHSRQAIPLLAYLLLDRSVRPADVAAVGRKGDVAGLRGENRRSSSIDPVLSFSSGRIFRPIQLPEKREASKACSPRRIASSTSVG